MFDLRHVSSASLLAANQDEALLKPNSSLFVSQTPFTPVPLFSICPDSVELISQGYVWA